ncbi:ATP-binding protein [Burkholderia multivorans]|uniref:ATP-binding protein n=2 Tax=Burkholderia multivorans TaxID=87883 RepID=UPI002019502F|nr:ATP-binding protein [Burkholderia multivorans]UQP21101.1 ATP-binding protein [Burkholderia multivorans]
MRHRTNISAEKAMWLRNPFVVVLVVAAAAVTSTPKFESLCSPFDQLHFDATAFAFANRGSNRVVLISKGEGSLRELGRERVFSPATNAELIDRLAGAISIVFDIPLPAREQFDDAFFDAIARNKRVVVGLPSTDTDTSGKLLLPLPDPAPKVVAAVGQRDVTVGHSGVVTGFVPYRTIGGSVYAHVSLEAIDVAGLGTQLPDLRLYAFPQTTSIGKRPRESVLLMLPRVKSVETYSFADVVTGRVAPSTFDGKIVFIGHAIYRPLGEYSVSSLNDDVVDGARLDAMITSALLNDDVVSEIPPLLQSMVGPVLALGMLLICWLTKTRVLHFYALGWGAGIFATSTLLLGLFHIWVPVGAALTVCLIVYSFFAWSQLLGMHRLLRREISRLRELSSSVGAVRLSNEDPHDAVDSNLLDEVKLAMQQIREWQEAYVGVINLLPYPVVLERSRKLVLWNSRAAELLGATVTDSGGIQAGEQPKLEMVLELFAAQRLGEAPAQEREVVLNGREYMLVNVPFAQFSPLALQDDTAHLICLVDIDDLKKSVINDRQTLRHIAHDLRNPLTTILALIEQQSVGMQDSLAGAHDEKFMHDLRRLVGYSLRMAQDFMQLSRADVLDPATFSMVDVADLVEEAVDQVGSFAETRSIRLALHRDKSETLWIDGNRDMLQRAVINVLDNAVKYSPEHTVVDVTVARDGQPGSRDVLIRVADQGVGIPGDAIPLLCEPFFQVDGKRRDAAAGVGLGLSFVRAVIGRHGGAISITSEVGRGTEVALSLPIATDSIIVDDDEPVGAATRTLRKAS